MELFFLASYIFKLWYIPSLNLSIIEKHKLGESQLGLAFFRTKPTLISDKAVSGGTWPCNPWTKKRQRISEILISESSGDMSVLVRVWVYLWLTAPPQPRTVQGENTLRTELSLIIFQLELPNAQCYCPVRTAATSVTGQMTDLLKPSHHICHLPRYYKALHIAFKVQLLLS